VKSKVILDPVFWDNGKVGLENYKKSYSIKKVEAKKFSVDDIKDINFSNKIV